MIIDEDEMPTTLLIAMVVKLAQKPEMQIPVSKRTGIAIFRNRLFSRLSTSPFVRFSDVVVPI